MRRKNTLIGIFSLTLWMSVLINGLAFAEDISIRFRIKLDNVERSIKTIQQFGEYRIERIEDKGIIKWCFEDEMTKIQWFPDNELKGMYFSLNNKTDYTIKIIWDGASFVDVNSKNHRVMHRGVKYIDRNNPQPATVVIRLGTLDDMIIPTDYISYSSSGWETLPLFRPEGGTANEVKFNALNYMGKSFQILLPFEVEGTVHEYIFIFKIYIVEIVDKR